MSAILTSKQHSDRSVYGCYNIKLFTRPDTWQTQDLLIHIQASYPLYHLSCCVLPPPENRSAGDSQTCIPDYFLLTSVWLTLFIFASLPGHRKNNITCLTAYSTAVKREVCLSYKSTPLVKNEDTIYYQLLPTLTS